ncbi:hypothetical protein [Alienimonas californiensis]|uniref:Uncharacterized protein n=1 Tax=Alienimonas californiensis TaxID=2527989 RepID=A0A517P9X4_9PLAN|nr:hypothetical protein [Alienimonas californiensis]QDT16165.1 hypothetical protein CA12_22630 [Alienimonas californiensis]
MPADPHQHTDLFHMVGTLFGGPTGWASAAAVIHWQVLLAGQWGQDSLEGMLAAALPAGLVAGAAGATAVERFASRRLALWHPLAVSFGGAWAGGAIAAPAALGAVRLISWAAGVWRIG